MHARHSMRLGAAIAHAMTVLLLSTWTALGADRPHIVVFLSDDHSQFDSSLYGNDKIPTPNFEELAAAGMTFTHAFVASPSCGPSRAALLTGLMPARTGAEPNHTAPRDGTHWLVQDLKAVGYEVVALGKVSHGTFPEAPGWDLHDGRFGPFLDKLGANVRDFLAGRKSDKPLCLFVGTTHPHVPWPDYSTFDPAKVELPPHHLDTPATRVHRAAYYQEIKDLDQLLGDLRVMAREHLGENVLFLHTSDHGSQWPFGKWNLYDYGIRVPLIVAWPGTIKPGVGSDAMISWVDVLPTLLAAVGGKAPEGIDGRSFLPVLRGERTSHRDIIFSTHTGDGRMNIYPIRSVRTREWKLIHNLHPEFAHTNHSDLARQPLAGAYWTEWAEQASRDPKARAIVDRYFRRPEFELYHVAEDKWELTNLADDPAQADRLAQMKRQLAAWMREQGDTKLVHSQPRLLAEPAAWHPDHIQTAPAGKKPAPKRDRSQNGTHRQKPAERFSKGTEVNGRKPRRDPTSHRGRSRVSWESLSHTGPHAVHDEEQTATRRAW
jgi:arylsulfatase A-like enzyme